MRFLLILSHASFTVKALNFRRIKRSSKICDFENPDIPMSTDVENSIVADDDYYRYDYYYPSRHYSYNVTWRIDAGRTNYPDDIEPVWTNRGACAREEINKSTWISKTTLHESLYGPETYNEYENCGQIGEIYSFCTRKCALMAKKPLFEFVTKT